MSLSASSLRKDRIISLARVDVAHFVDQIIAVSWSIT